MSSGGQSAKCVVSLFRSLASVTPLFLPSDFLLSTLASQLDANIVFLVGLEASGLQITFFRHVRFVNFFLLILFKANMQYIISHTKREKGFSRVLSCFSFLNGLGTN